MHATGGVTPLEAALDSLLNHAEGGSNAVARERETPPDVSPLDQLRAAFVDRLIPLVDSIQIRYAGSGVGVSMDASDFLNGGRSMQIDIHYRTHSSCLEGTVMPNAIAFHETRYVSDLGGTVAGGPMLRTRHLTDQAFMDFIYERIIQLVKSEGRPS